MVATDYQDEDEVDYDDYGDYGEGDCVETQDPQEISAPTHSPQPEACDIFDRLSAHFEKFNAQTVTAATIALLAPVPARDEWLDDMERVRSTIDSCAAQLTVLLPHVAAKRPALASVPAARHPRIPAPAPAARHPRIPAPAAPPAPVPAAAPVPVTHERSRRRAARSDSVSGERRPFSGSRSPSRSRGRTIKPRNKASLSGVKCQPPSTGQRAQIASRPRAASDRTRSRSRRRSSPPREARATKPTQQGSWRQAPRQQYQRTVSMGHEREPQRREVPTSYRGHTRSWQRHDDGRSHGGDNRSLQRGLTITTDSHPHVSEDVFFRSPQEQQQQQQLMLPQQQLPPPQQQQQQQPPVFVVMPQPAGGLFPVAPPPQSYPSQYGYQAPVPLASLPGQLPGLPPRSLLDQALELAHTPTLLPEQYGDASFGRTVDFSHQAAHVPGTSYAPYPERYHMPYPNRRY
jgi:hypothetical protein